jgi:RNA polymerase sigma factor (sigma-70 family)
MSTPEEEITVYLRRSRSTPDRGVQDRLYRLVENQLKVLARSLLGSRDRDHTLQPTVLVDEAFVRLMNAPNKDWESRSQFFRIAHGTMRRILIDHLRRRRPGKIDDEAAARLPDHRHRNSAKRIADQESMRLLAVAIQELEQSDPQAADTFMLSFFHRLRKQTGEQIPELLADYGGENLPIRDVAKKRGQSLTTAWRQLGKALGFLQERLVGENADS